MSRRSKQKEILAKAKEAAVAAISSYNQPRFPYREETFCILMINAWELLLKAKIVSQALLYRYYDNDEVQARSYQKSGNQGFLTLNLCEMMLPQHSLRP